METSSEGELMWRSGDVAPESGLYELIEAGGKRTGTIKPIERGEKFPTTPRRGSHYALVKHIAAVGTSVASNAVILGTSTDFRAALDELAEK